MSISINTAYTFVSLKFIRSVLRISKHLAPFHVNGQGHMTWYGQNGNLGTIHVYHKMSATPAKYFCRNPTCCWKLFVMFIPPQNDELLLMMKSLSSIWFWNVVYYKGEFALCWQAFWVFVVSLPVMFINAPISAENVLINNKKSLMTPQVRTPLRLVFADHKPGILL